MYLRLIHNARFILCYVNCVISTDLLIILDKI